MIPESKIVTTNIGEPVHVTLTKNTKGYQWEISVFGSDSEKVMTTINTININLQKEYGGVENDKM